MGGVERHSSDKAKRIEIARLEPSGMPARPCLVRSLQLLDVARPVPIQPACSISSTATKSAWALSRSSASLVQEVNQVYEGSCYFCVGGSLGNPQTVTRVLATFFRVAGHRNGSSGSFDGALNKPCVPNCCESCHADH